MDWKRVRENIHREYSQRPWSWFERQKKTGPRAKLLLLLLLLLRLLLQKRK